MRRRRAWLGALLALAVALPASACDVDALSAVPKAERGGITHLLRLRACLADPDPAVRDAFAYSRYVEILRGGEATPDTLETLLADFVFRLSVRGRDADGFENPFLVLVLAEIARVDRVSPFLDDAKRNLLVGAAWRYLRGVTDYRGFVEGEGWRHGVAHGADLAMQLALNPALTPAQGNRLLQALATQVAPESHHSYIFEEPGRLARPVFFLATQSRASDAGLDAFFAAVAPDPEAPRWQSPYQSEAGLAALHNTRSFARALYVYASLNDTDAGRALLERTENLLGAIP